jgi:hypothetical protein
MELTTGFNKTRGPIVIRRGAEVVRGWRHPNRPTVCTGGAVAPGDWVFPLKRACEIVLWKKGANCRTRDNKA